MRLRPRLLGEIKRLVGLGEQRRNIEQTGFGDHHAHAYGAADRTAVDLESCFLE